MSDDEAHKQLQLLERRLARERESRKQAEQVLEQKSRELYTLNQSLITANSELQKLSMAVQQSPSQVAICNLEGTIEYVNDAFCKVTGYTRDELIGKRVSLLRHEDNLEDMLVDIREARKQFRVWQGQVWNRSKTGTSFIVSLTISPIYGAGGKVTHFLYTSEDITRQKQNEEQIYHLAHHDHLTGLHNRFSLEDRLTQCLYTAERAKNRIAILFLDLDRFKAINDTYGHKAGDEVLKQAAQRLEGICRRKSDIVARIGGDEFVVVLTDISDVSFVGLTALAIVKVLSLPYFYQDTELNSTPSMGISVYPDDGNTSEELLNKADSAMYQVKQRGKGDYSFYTRDLNEFVSDKMRIEQDLRQAVAEGQLELNFQPLHDTTNETVFGVEVLTRWIHPEHGSVSPGKFIRIAEDCGLIHELGQWIVATAVEQFSRWQLAQTSGLCMLIKLSEKQLESDSLADELVSAVKEHGLEADRIVLELTESALMKMPEETCIRLEELSGAGFGLVIDDFGTGFSSLTYLSRLPITALKLDSAFVRDLEHTPRHATICKATISLAHSLGFSVIAKGVETGEQQHFLLKQQCDYLQGYLLSRPKSSAEMYQYLVETGALAQKPQPASL